MTADEQPRDRLAMLLHRFHIGCLEPINGEQPLKGGGGWS